MNSTQGNGEKKGIGALTVRLPREMLDRLEQFCLDHGVKADTVVERALREYFREGDMCH